MHDWSRLLDAIGADQIDHIMVTVVGQLTSGKVMGPPKIEARYTWPMTGNITMVTSNLFLCDWKYAAAAEAGNSINSGFFFPGRIRVNNLLPLFLCEMLSI